MSATAVGKPPVDGGAALFLGVDGGGSKTEAVVVDEHGGLCGRGHSSSSNFRAVGVERAIHHLGAAIEEALASAGGVSPLASAWFGLAGIHRAEDAEVLSPRLQRFARDVSLTNDAELVLAGLGSGPGVALIAGTGSIALGRGTTGQIVQVGGWGHLIGDEGSAYDLGRQALQAAARAADGRGPATALLELALRHWALTEPREIVERVYLAQEKAHIAALARGALALARNGDPVARAIRRHACAELASAAIAALDALHLSMTAIPLALGGGLLMHEPDMRAAVIRRIRRRRTLGRVTIVTEPALWAARALAGASQAVNI